MVDGLRVDDFGGRQNPLSFGDMTASRLSMLLWMAPHQDTASGTQETIRNKGIGGEGAV